MRYRRTHARLLAACCVAASLAGAGRAVAEPTAEEQALATTLFREAKALLEAGEVAKACPKLAESQQLYPAGGTLLNLAVCHEKEGKTATAWAEFREARVVAERDRRDDRVALADEHIAALEPKLSKVVVNVSPAADIEGTQVSVDRRPLRRPAWGTAMPIDPGTHVIEARAPGKKEWRAEIVVQAEADVATALVPAWEDEVAPVAAPSPTPAEVPPGPPRALSSTSGRTAALVTGGIGVTGLVIGSIFGLRAIAKHDEGKDACTMPCSTSLVSLNDSAKTAADVSTVAFAAGVVALGVGAYLWFTAASPDAKARSAHIVPGLGARF
jgi:hypothetical protein